MISKLRNFYAKFLPWETHANCADIWDDIDQEIVEARHLFAATVPESTEFAM